MTIRAALTFDAEHADRPGAGGTGRVLDVLATAGARATFFLQGRWVEAHPTVARSIAEAGHVVGSHGHYHGRMSHLTDDGIRDDLRRAETAICEKVGVDPRPWFRCPFGDGASDPRVLGLLHEAGYRHVGWDVDAEDWQVGATAVGLVTAVLDGVRRVGDGAVVLLHAWPGPTPAVVASVLAAGGAEGVEFVGIDELGVPPVESVPW